MKPDQHTASLPLPEPADPFTTRDAYALTPEVTARLTYEQAMATPSVAIGLRNFADAVRRARRQHCPDV